MVSKYCPDRAATDEHVGIHLPLNGRKVSSVFDVCVAFCLQDQDISGHDHTDDDAMSDTKIEVMSCENKLVSRLRGLAALQHRFDNGYKAGRVEVRAMRGIGQAKMLFLSIRVRSKPQCEMV